MIARWAFRVQGLEDMLSDESRAPKFVQPELIDHHRRLKQSSKLLNATNALEKKPQKVPSMVIVLGLPRSGSSAVHEFFECSRNILNDVPDDSMSSLPQYSSSHYCCDDRSKREEFNSEEPRRVRFPCQNRTCGSCVHSNLLQGSPPFHNCTQHSLGRGDDHLQSQSTAIPVWSQFDVETQVPFSWFLPQQYAIQSLHRHYPDATWILNTRASARAWAVNVLHWHTDTQRLLQAFNVSYYSDAAIESTAQTTALLRPNNLSRHKLYQELQHSLDRAGSTGEYRRRRTALETAYARHSTRIEQAHSHWYNTASAKERLTKKNSQQLQQGAALVRLNVDDPNAGQVLAAAFPNTKAECWKFDPVALDNDWQDFSFEIQ
jgi:hypothetical protein